MEGSSSSSSGWRRGTGGSPMDFIDVDMDAAFIIDLEDNDNYLQISPPIPPISRVRHPRITLRSTVVYQTVGMEVAPAQSGPSTENRDRTLSLNSLNSIHGSVSGKEVIHCKHCSGWKEVDNFSKKNVESSSQITTLPLEVPAATCPVCMSEFTDPCSTICGHIFCEYCVSMSIKNSNRCPTCRKQLTKEDFHRVYLP